MTAQREQPTRRILGPLEKGVLWGVGAALIAGAIWAALNLNNPSQTAVFDRMALNHANQLLHFQVMLNGEGKPIQPTLEKLREIFLARNAWQDAPDGVIVLEPPSTTKYCFAVRHAQGSQWYLVYEDLGTARQMPDTGQVPTCQ